MCTWRWLFPTGSNIIYDHAKCISYFLFYMGFSLGLLWVDDRDAHNFDLVVTQILKRVSQIYFLHACLFPFPFSTFAWVGNSIDFVFPSSSIIKTTSNYTTKRIIIYILSFTFLLFFYTLWATIILFCFISDFVFIIFVA